MRITKGKIYFIDSYNFCALVMCEGKDQYRNIWSSDDYPKEKTFFYYSRNTMIPVYRNKLVKALFL